MKLDWYRIVSYVVLGLFDLAVLAGFFLLATAFWQKFGARFS